MTASLKGKRVLVVEDDYFVAKSLADDLRDAGAEVIGPVATVAEALELIGAEELDAVVLDVNLRGVMAYPVADRLLARGLPFVLATGYSSSTLPSRYVGAPHCDKPVEVSGLAAALFPTRQPRRIARLACAPWAGDG